ncbi:MAG: ABC transporter ATP-binding protein [Bacteroidota bacterium]
MKPIIEIRKLGKQYRLGYVGTGTLSHDLNRWWHKFRGKEDPYLKIGEKNDRTSKGSSEYVWSLQDIDLDVMPGDVLGIIGANGAGKSTLLKLLSRITTPTTGYIKTRGRIASLLEVGTGFHPELTGKENIFLNGAILGMTKSEINAKFQQIVHFAGCERYIDTPVKRYSSGMYVRLAFAVAAHLEPEILIVDEVLAVGDAEFQKKAIGKMKDVSTNHGRTVLFVSHNMNSIRSLCNKAIILDKGRILYSGMPNDCINFYLNHGQSSENIIDGLLTKRTEISIHSFKVNGKSNKHVQIDSQNRIIALEISGELTSVANLTIYLSIYDANRNKIAFHSKGVSRGEFVELLEGQFKMFDELEFPKNMLSGTYYIDADLLDEKYDSYMSCEKCIELSYNGISVPQAFKNEGNQGFFVLD